MEATRALRAGRSGTGEGKPQTSEDDLPREIDDACG
jgi:hypothetical protein